MSEVKCGRTGLINRYLWFMDDFAMSTNEENYGFVLFSRVEKQLLVSCLISDVLRWDVPQIHISLGLVSASCSTLGGMFSV